MSEVTTLATTKVLNDAMAIVQDPSKPVEDRAAMFGLLTAFKRRIDQALGTYARHKATPKTELTEYLVRSGLEELGPLYLAWEGFDVRWPVNSEGNWVDSTLQEQLESFAKVAPDYIRHVPEHYEIRTAELGKGVADADPIAKRLHRECKERGWRVEGGRNASLKVREVKAPKGKAAA